APAPHGLGVAPPGEVFLAPAEQKRTVVTERKLRAVEPGEKAPAKRTPRKVAPRSVEAAAKSGDLRQMLVALRNRIAKAVDDPKTPAPALAALIRQQMDIAARIQAIDLAADAFLSRPGSTPVIATTPDESWDESMI
ncbi:hypothetical protein P3H80_21055, partial [Mycolicibacterium septicum]|uniref:hypothetical protein n=1 Tax=Mycolicibacterium septicum TaxID=98668 RepID=UPI0023E17817